MAITDYCNYTKVTKLGTMRDKFAKWNPYRASIALPYDSIVNAALCRVC